MRRSGIRSLINSAPNKFSSSRLYQSGDSQSKESNASFLDDLAAATAAPGGGSAAAYAGAMGAALIAMVAGLTIGKKKYVAVEAEMQAVRVQAEELRKELTERGRR